jgi:hypothetical protein
VITRWTTTHCPSSTMARRRAGQSFAIDVVSVSAAEVRKRASQ